MKHICVCPTYYIYIYIYTESISNVHFVRVYTPSGSVLTCVNTADTVLLASGIFDNTFQLRRLQVQA